MRTPGLTGVELRIRKQLDELRAVARPDMIPCDLSASDRCASDETRGFTLQVPGDLMEGGRIAIDIEGADIGRIGIHAQLLFEEMREVGGRYWRVSWGAVRRTECHRPSEAIEAPERRKSSEPIWMEKTFSEGKLQEPLLG